ncbi:molybdopterin-dependent oxidoreductase [candidate division KSB1 bacterium]|nr:molybdopterin-dependent oxidoreductase [candidate division KSB1 bacterium]
MSRVIGHPTPYIDARRKVTGEALYTDDYRFSNALHVHFLRSPHAHALIKSIDASAAEANPRVRAIAVGKELPTAFGILPISPDETAMAIEKVRFVGEIVAAVAADTKQAAMAAAHAIRVEYELLPAVLDPEEALQSCEPGRQIHDHSRDRTNIHKTAELSFNDPEAGLQESTFVRSAEFKFAGVTHAFTEPHATWATYSPDGELTVISATQVPHYLQRTLSTVLGLPRHRVRVVKPTLGGGFGGKGDPFPHELITAHLAMKTGQPVRCSFSREEVFLTNHGRHPTTLTMSVGCDKSGKLTALHGDIVIDGGAFASFGVVTTYYNGVLLQGPYRIDRFGFRTRRVYTNKPQSGAMRGHGAVNSRYAVETLLDMLARDAGMDPCDFRMQNFLPAHTQTVGQLRITSNGVRECLEAVRKRSGWDQRFGKLPFGRGIGVACGFYISGSALPIIWNRQPQSVVHAKLDADGSIVIFSGASDIGQGSDTMLAQIAAEVLGVPLSRIRVVTADTSLAPVDLGSYSSRVTFMAGNAAKSAVEKVRHEIALAVSQERKVDADALCFDHERVLTADGQVDVSWDEAVEIATAFRGSFVESGFYISPKLGGDFKGSGAGLSPSYSFGAAVSEVAVNHHTGEVRVIKVWSAHDCGKALNPLAVEGQMEGSIHMGLGQVLSEELRYDNGRLLNANLADYRIPTALDTPEMDVTIVESADPEGPFGAKEVGEGPIHPVLPSIGNAIFDAVGVRMYELPITPEKVRRALRQGSV